MGRLRQKGKAGAAKAYITRSQAVKKLQCTLADFRRLCILKGIFPREPRSRKKANKGSTAPTSFYYAKDIAYLAHEPVLTKLREHKAFAKKLSRALGRGEWSSAKSLEEQKPVYRLDHIIKQRYPTFIDAVRDIDDALCLIFVFANLPTIHARIPSALIESCSRLAAEWQLYVMRSRSLRKVFLSIKGIYYQADIMGELVTWIVPYQFTQTIPTEVDVRVMLTFLELYQTLLGFVFFKLYTDIGLVYPPPLDAKKDESGAGVGAYSLQEANRTIPNDTSNTAAIPKTKKVEVNGKLVSGKDVKRTIKNLAASGAPVDEEPPPATTEDIVDDTLPSQEEFIAQPSSDNTPSTLPTLHTLNTLSSTTIASANLFSPYTFYLSRESPRFILEFIIRSFGGKVGWPETVGAGSPFGEDDPSITHVIIDRPSIIPDPQQSQDGKDTEGSKIKVMTEVERRRKYVQPQWVCDCVNAGRILLEEAYARGQVLPPHLSPFGEAAGAYDPQEEPTAAVEEDESEEEVIEGEELPDEDEEQSEEDNEEEAFTGVSAPTELPPPPPPQETKKPKAKLKKKKTSALDGPAVVDPESLRKAELEAERAGVEPAEFEEHVQKLVKKRGGEPTSAEDDGVTAPGTQDNPNKMLMSNKRRKLYEKMKYSQRQKEQEKSVLEKKKATLVKKKRKEYIKS